MSFSESFHDFPCAREENSGKPSPTIPTLPQLTLSVSEATQAVREPTVFLVAHIFSGPMCRLAGSERGRARGEEDPEAQKAGATACARA